MRDADWPSGSPVRGARVIEHVETAYYRLPLEGVGDAGHGTIDSEELITVQVAADGMPATFRREDAVAVLTGAEVNITVDLRNGDASATAWGCDLTHGYVDINASYST